MHPLTQLPLLFAALAAGPEPTEPHSGSPVYMAVSVGDRVVETSIVGEQQTVLFWFLSEQEKAEYGPVELASLAFDMYSQPLSSEARTTLKGAMTKVVAEHLTMSIDGELVTPTVEVARVPGDDETGFGGVPGLEFVLRYPVERAPRALDLSWTQWDRILWQDERKFVVQIESEQSKTRVEFLTDEEPGFTWRPEPEDRTPAIELEPVGLRQAEPYRLSVVAFGCIGLAILLAPLAWFVKSLRGVYAVLAFLLTGSGWMLRDQGVIEIQPTEDPVIAPHQVDAKRLFETLHANVYQAFGTRGEERTYKQLQVCVTNDLVPELYLDIHESLVMRNQQGAYCQIESVDIREVEVLDSEQPWLIVDDELSGRPRFDVRCTWEADGVVSHWGHEHRRTNEHEAEFAVVHDGQSWKIAALNTVYHDRVDSDG